MRLIKLLIGTVLIFSTNTMASESLSLLEKKINIAIEKKVLVDLQLAKLQSDIQTSQKDIREKRKILIQRSRALSYLRDIKWGGLFAADNPSSFERNLLILNRLNKHDLLLFKEYRAMLKNLASLRKNLQFRQDELQQVVSQLKEEETKLQEIEEKYKQSVINEKKQSLITDKGHLVLPIHRPVSNLFGAKNDNLNQYAVLVKGILFKSEVGDEVRAVSPGKVIFSDHVPYWGETIIVQHADDYYSVYAGLSRLVKTVDRSVTKNELIAVTGQEQFYFELRHNDQPLNPINWFDQDLKKSKKLFISHEGIRYE